MLPVPRRIRRADEFRAVARFGAKAGGSVVVVEVAQLRSSSPGQSSRAGFVVGRAVGGSVQRHRVVRRLRHAVLPLLDEVPDGAGVVVRARPGALTCTFDELSADLSRTLRRALRRHGATLGVGRGPGTPHGVSQ